MMTEAVSTGQRRHLDGPETGTRACSMEDGRTLTYREFGAPSGTPVVLLHGTPGSRHLGELFHDAAGERNVRLLAPDRPGYGRSDPLPDRTLGDTHQFVGALLDDAGVENAGVVGFSGGGPHAIALAAARPDRVTQVDVIAGAPPPGLTERTPLTQRAFHRLARSTPWLLNGLLRGQAWLASRTSPSIVVSLYTSDDGQGAIPADVADVVRRDFVEAVGSQRQGLLTETRLLAEEWDLSLDVVESAVRLWHGDADTNVPLAGVRRLTTQLPDSHLEVFEGTDHLNTLRRSIPLVLDQHSPNENCSS